MGSLPVLYRVSLKGKARCAENRSLGVGSPVGHRVLDS